MRRTSKGQNTMVSGLLKGTATSLILTIAACGMLAKLIESEILGETAGEYGIIPILILSSWLGTTVSIGIIRENRLLISLYTAILYCLTLLGMTMIFFEARYTGIGENSLLILCGSLLASMLGLSTKTRKKVPKLKIPNR